MVDNEVADRGGLFSNSHGHSSGRCLTIDILVTSGEVRPMPSAGVRGRWRLVLVARRVRGSATPTTGTAIAQPSRA